MFAPANRAPFGASPTTFGFNAPTNPNPFGQQTQMFGTANATFGAATPAFGQTAAPMFGATQQQQQQQPLFGNTTAPAFGSNIQNTFGQNTTLFGQNQNPPAANLFGTTNNAFGQQSKSSGFSFNAPQPSGMFGQAQQPAQQTNMFQPSTSTNMFGASSFGGQTQQTGTPIKFTPVTSTDSMQKGGSSTMIQTKHHSITCMKEYEGKSFEELRCEDYSVNRKGPQPASGFTSAPAFGTVVSSAPSLFGQPENKPAFGQSNTFGQTTAFGTNQPSTSAGVFGKPATGFGPTTTASSFGAFTSTASANVFGAPAASKSFGVQSTPSLFGQQSTSGFGSTPFFGQASTQQPGFQTSQPAAFSFGQTPASTTNSLFQPSKPSTGFSLFNQNTTTTAGFGQQPTSGFTGFSSFSKPAQTFGQPAQTGFSNMQGGTLFGNNAAKPTFGNQSLNLFNNMQPTNNFSLQPQQAQQQIGLGTQSQADDVRNMFNMIEPYGFAPHLDGLKCMSPSDTHYTTNPKDIDNVLKAQDKNPTSSPVIKKVKVTSPPPQNKWSEFETAYEEEPDYNSINFKINNSTKKLHLKGGPLKKPEPLVVFNEGQISGGDTSTSNAYASLPSAFKTPSPECSTEIPAADKSSMTEKDVSVSVKDVQTEPRRSKSKSPEPTPYTGTNNLSISSTSTADTSSSKKPSIDTCGITCTRPEYYTIPPLDKIAQYKNSDGSCMIKGFTIGRIGYGNVFFPDIMDVSNLNIDKLVHFRYKEVSIYGENDDKPPIGEGLNRRAQVTLDRVYPKRETNKDEFETDPDTLIADNFGEVLRMASSRLSSSFVDYRPETGSWVFNVEHFSKYGLSDLEEQQYRDELKKKQSQKEKDDKEAEKRKENENKENVQVAKHRGLGGMPLEESKPTYTSPYELAPATSTTRQHIDLTSTLMDYETSRHDPGMSMMMNTFVDDNFASGDKVKQMDVYFDDVPQKIILEKIEKPRVKVPRPNLYKLTNTTVRVPINRSMIPSKGIMDAAIFKGRSFKVGWSRGFTIAALGNSNITRVGDFEELFMPNTVTLLTVSDTCKELNKRGNFDPFLDTLDDYMNLILSDVSFSDSSIPLVKINISGNVLFNMELFAKKHSKSNRDNKYMEYYKHIWGLCMAFWGKCDPKESYTTRRIMFQSWLEAVTSELVRHDMAKYGIFNDAETALKKILSLLSGHQIKRAAEMAFQRNYPQLGMLISQLAAGNTTKYCTRYQIQLWNDNTSIEHIEEDVLKLYLLACGAPMYNDVNVCENMDWLRTLGVYFWYITPSSKPVTHAIQMYEEAFNTTTYAEKPITALGDELTWDIMFFIMKLYCNPLSDLSQLLKPSTHSGDSTDYRMSWLLLQTFESLGVGLISEQAKLHITTIFSTQLEQLGMYKWAIFVLMFIPDVTVRKNLVMGVLDRNLSEESEDTERDIVLKLKIPIKWLHQVKAVKCEQLGRYWLSYKHLAHSQMWREAHDFIFKHILPNLICNHDFELLRDILHEISAGSGQIYRWKNRGGLLIEFINVWTFLQQKKKDMRVVDLKKLQNQVMYIVTRLKSFPSSKPFEVMIISEISKFCSTFNYSILKQLPYDSQTLLRQSSDFIQQLVMPFDYKFEEINKSVCVMYK
ncbi:PREDICTED: nuclear pore complex protein Nup98-Nup96 isoform X2 [Nicrophorus vespilloides]|uniref:Nuclear pore complex protein Nup98-Nup96 n=1 Tax=Nicrophorus vespilloides TaxID=110193 RepID=A0ABM1MY93_NICVS|nr:PREDICTED: nuclear pore complex protein Nup98-Nup96 isoform X2 [Nicrophorus vespilloides]